MISGKAGWGLAVAVAAGLLFLGYLRVSWTVAATADGAAQALQARDMLAGNWLLHGWTLSDVSFYTTELPEYVLIELLRPFGASVIHVAAAVTYTLLVLSAFALARGRSRGTEGLVRGLLTAGIMLAPQLGYGAFVLLLSPDHLGTQVPLLVGWLFLDLAPRRWWVPAAMCLLLAWVQFADRVALLTAVVPLIIVCVVSAARRLPRLPAGRAESAGCHRESADSGSLGVSGCSQRSTISSWWAHWTAGGYEIGLGCAAVGSVGVAWVAARALAAAGGFTGHPLPFSLAPLGLLWTHAWLTGWGILELYGANFLGVRGWAGLTFAGLHLVGLALAVAGAGIALCRFICPAHFHLAPNLAPNLAPKTPAWLWQRAGYNRPVATTSPRLSGSSWPRGTSSSLADGGSWPRGTSSSLAGGSFVDSVLAVAVVLNLVSYVISIQPGTVLGTGYDAREIAAVLPLGAVLAGRTLGPKLARAVLPAPGRSRGRRVMGAGGGTRARSVTGFALVLTLVFAAYSVAFGYAAAQPAGASPDAALARWLVAHGLRYGLGGAAANVLTTWSAGRAVVVPVRVSQGRVVPSLYQSAVQAFAPERHDATFLVAGTPAERPGDPAEIVPDSAVRATFGAPERVFRFAGYTVDVWGVNLLTKMRE